MSDIVNELGLPSFFREKHVNFWDFASYVGPTDFLGISCRVLVHPPKSLKTHPKSLKRPPKPPICVPHAYDVARVLRDTFNKKEVYFVDETTIRLALFFLRFLGTSSSMTTL